MSKDIKTLMPVMQAPKTKLGDLRKIAAEIKCDHALAMKLWESGNLNARHLAILIMDKKKIDQALVDRLDADMQQHSADERVELMDWLMANQLSKDKKNIALMESWENSPSTLQRRIFWYYQARLRWMGKSGHSNTEDLLRTIENNLMEEEPEVQWAMNYTAAQIGKWQEKYRQWCIDIGEQSGLYRDEVVARNCTPSYIPAFIEVELAKMQKG